MSEDRPKPSVSSEVVGVIDTREHFSAAVEALLAAGFSRADLSALASHETIDVAGRPSSSWRDALTAIVGELKYEGPLVASGAIFLAGGPVAATIAAVIGTAVGGVAIGDVLREVTARPHSEDFARAVDAGSLILWVAVDDDAQRAMATSILAQFGATNVHVIDRKPAAASA